MSEHRILVVENPCRISVHLDRIRIEREDHEDLFVLPDDVAVMVLHADAVQITAPVLRRLVRARAILIVTDEKHHPSGCLTPLGGSPQSSLRLRQQLALSHDFKGRLWKSIVQSRIQTQAENLRHFKLNGALRLERLAAEVMDNDRGNHEAQGTKHYWKCLLGDAFRRSKQGAEDTANAALNYGYAVLRSLVAREVAIASLTPMLGVGHRSQENPFNLADDLMEPFRFVVEREVRKRLYILEAFDASARMAVLEFVRTSVRIGASDYRLPAAIRETVTSYCRVLESGDGSLLLPGQACR